MPGSGAHVVLDPSNGRLGFEQITGEVKSIFDSFYETIIQISVATYEPEKNKRFKFLESAPIPTIEKTKDRSQLALIGMSSVPTSQVKSERVDETSKPKKKKKKRKHDNSQIEPPVKIERV